MPVVTEKSISSIIFNSKGNLFVPENIEQAIVPCVKSHPNLIQQAGLELQRAYKPTSHAVTVDYDRVEIIDAYSFYYLRRNTLIPRIAFRDLCLNSNFQEFPDNLRFLDVGSGAGAVTLGLMEMFLHPQLQSIDIHVDAIDKSSLSLQRLKDLQNRAGLSQFSLTTMPVDINDPLQLESFLDSHPRYNFVFLANVFNEVEHSDACAVIGSIVRHLADNAAIVITSAQRDFIKELQPLLIEIGVKGGLNVYYPCPSINVGVHDCWFWREHDYEYKLSAIEKQFKNTNNREQLSATWLILSNAGLSIFDNFLVNYPALEWGVFRIRGKYATVDKCELCTTSGLTVIGPQKQDYKRGSIVGFTQNPFQINSYFEL